MKLNAYLNKYLSSGQGGFFGNKSQRMYPESGGQNAG